MNRAFFYNTKAEWLKTRKTSIIWLTILAAAFLPVINALILLNRPEVFVPKLKSSSWLVFLHMNWKSMAFFLLPLYVILLNNAIAQIEYRNHGWKQVYALPRTYIDIFFSKFLVVTGYLILFVILFNGCMIVAGSMVGWLHPAYTFWDDRLPVEQMLVFSSRATLGIMGVTAFQYWLSIRFSNYIIPLGIGIGLLLAGLILIDWEKIIYFPYVYSIFLFFAGAPDRTTTLASLLAYATIAFVVFISAGCAETYFRKEKG